MDSCVLRACQNEPHISASVMVIDNTFFFFFYRFHVLSVLKELTLFNSWKGLFDLEQHGIYHATSHLVHPEGEFPIIFI